MKRLPLLATLFSLTCPCLAQTRPAFPVGEEEQIRMLVKLRSHLVMASNGTMLPYGLWQQKTKRTEEAVAKLLAIKEGWWAQYKDVTQPEVMYSGAAWRNAAVLACAWDMPQSRYFQSKEVLASIEAGLRHLLKFAYPGCPKPGNWWAWEIGMPMGLLEALTLCGDGLDLALWQQEIETLVELLKVGDDARLSGAATFPLKDVPGHTDMNELWRTRLRLQLAILMKKPAMAAKWAQASMSEIGRPGEGFWQADYSYKFHGSNPMWAYGHAFLHDYAELMEVYRDSPFAPSPAQVDRFAQMALHYSNGFLYHSAMCPALTGREITRGDNVSLDIFGPPAVHALAVLARLGHPQAREMAAIVARDIRYFMTADVSQQVAEWTAGCPRVPPASPVDDIFAYPDSDFLQITRPNWAAGIKMHSSRNKGYESINGENLQGWFLSHGSIWPLLLGSEWKYSWPALDWTRLPGTTVCRDIKDPNTSPFAGVLKLSPQRAIAAMELICNDFHARKSWFVDSDCIVCLGSGIHGPGRVETTVFNQPAGPDTRILLDGEELPADAFDKVQAAQSVWFERVGYLFVQAQKLHILREKRTSDWSSVRDAKRFGAGETREQWFLTGILAHDKEQPGYGYIVIPDVSSEQMAELAKSVPARYRIQAGDSHDIAAADGSWQAHVFWQPQVAGPIAASAGCLIGNLGKDWGAADPAWSDKPLRIEIDGQKFDLAPRRGRRVSTTQPGPPS